MNFLNFIDPNSLQRVIRLHIYLFMDIWRRTQLFSKHNYVDLVCCSDGVMTTTIHCGVHRTPSDVVGMNLKRIHNQCHFVTTGLTSKRWITTHRKPRGSHYYLFTERVLQALHSHTHISSVWAKSKYELGPTASPISVYYSHSIGVAIGRKYRCDSTKEGENVCVCVCSCLRGMGNKCLVWGSLSVSTLATLLQRRTMNRYGAPSE